MNVLNVRISYFESNVSVIKMLACAKLDHSPEFTDHVFNSQSVNFVDIFIFEFLTPFVL